MFFLHLMPLYLGEQKLSFLNNKKIQFLLCLFVLLLRHLVNLSAALLMPSCWLSNCHCLFQARKRQRNKNEVLPLAQSILCTLFCSKRKKKRRIFPKIFHESKQEEEKKNNRKIEINKKVFTYYRLTTVFFFAWSAKPSLLIPCQKKKITKLWLMII